MLGSMQVRSVDKRHQKLKSLDLRVDIQISSAFVTVTSEWWVGKDGWYTLEIPMNPNTTITHIEITTDNILIQSAIIPEEEFKVYFRSNTQNVEYDHDVFNFPFELKGGHSKASQVIRVFVTYFEGMTFDATERRYSFTFPMVITENIVDRSQIPALHAYATINTATDRFQWGSARHPLQVVSRNSATSIELDCRDFYPRINQNFEINYSIVTNEILCSLLVNEANLDPYDPRQTFCVNIHPPPETALHMGAFGRKIVFLIDVSGSMQGEPLQQAILSLRNGLQMMKPTDYFTICAFNHTSSFWQPGLQQASPQWIASAQAWCTSLIASGGTNIMAPTQLAVDILRRFPDQGQVPMIFLLTDGAVDNETEIFHWVAANCSNIRVHTLGIGKFCNAYFLKMVALAGRGLNDQIMSSKFIQTQFLNMLKSANTPILTNVEVLLPVQNSQYEVFPNPIPDLFCGNPLVISGKSGQYFDHVLIRGSLPNNVPFQAKAYPLMVPIYLHGIFVKQRLDYLVGQAWLTKDLNVKKQAIDLSCRAHIPSPYTTMVAYSVDPQKRPNRQLTAAEIAAISVGGVIAIVGLGMTLGSVLDTGLITGVFNHMGGGGDYLGGGHGGGFQNCNCCGNNNGSCNCGGCGNGDCCTNGCCGCGDCGCCQCNGCNCDCHCGDCGACDCNGCSNCDCGGCGDCGGGGCDCNC